MSDMPKIECMLTITEEQFREYEDNQDLLRKSIHPTPIQRTCEHCKFWDRYKDYDPRQCLNEKVINLVDGGPEEEPYYHKDFGCIFWESKE